MVECFVFLRPLGLRLGLSNMFTCSVDEAAHLFSKLEELHENHNINVYIAINSEEMEMPEDAGACAAGAAGGSAGDRGFSEQGRHDG